MQEIIIEVGDVEVEFPAEADVIAIGSDHGVIELFTAGDVVPEIIAYAIGPKGEKGDTGTVTPEMIAARDRAEAAADEAEASQTAAASSAADALSYRDSAALHAGDANDAKNAAEAARADLETAKTAAETAQAGAETARAGAETARTGAEAALTDAGVARDDAIAARMAAEASADDAADSVVTAGQLAFAADASADAAALSETAAGVSAGLAQTAQLAAEANVTEAQAARDDALAAASDALVSKNDAAASATSAADSLADANIAKTGAEAARDDALQSQTNAAAARDEAVLAQGAAEGARDEALQARYEAVAAESQSEAARDAAQGYAQAAQASAEAAAASDPGTMVSKAANGSDFADPDQVRINIGAQEALELVERLEAETGTSTVVRNWNALRIAQAIAALAPTKAHTHTVADINGLEALLDAKAPLDSPELQGTPTAPTPTAGDRSNRIATTGFVMSVYDQIMGGADDAYNTFLELQQMMQADDTQTADIISQLATKASIVHTHGISEVDGLQSALDGKLGATATAAAANKLAAARTIALTGDVTGSVAFDGSANVSITATIVDDSHNHVISNVDGLQAALDAKLDATAQAADSAKLGGLTPSQFLRSDTYVGNGNVLLPSTIGAGIKFWNGSDAYSIQMSSYSDTTYGGRLDTTSDYNMYFTMTGGTNRGFVFKNGATAVAQIESTGRLIPKGGLKVPNATASAGNDVSKHIDLYGGSYGFSITGSTLNHVSGANHNWWSASTNTMRLNSAGEIWTSAYGWLHEYIAQNAPAPQNTGNLGNVILAAPSGPNGTDFLNATSSSLAITSKGLSVASPLIAVVGQGFDTSGIKNKLVTKTANVTWTNLAPKARNYLYLDEDGNPGSTSLPPERVMNNLRPAKNPGFLWHCENSQVDDFGNNVSFERWDATTTYALPVFNNTISKFGTYSVELTRSQANWFSIEPGFSITDTPRGWTVETWFRKKDAVTHTLFSFSEQEIRYGNATLLCGINAAGKLFLYASSDMLVGATWNIANNVASGATAITDTTTFHHYALSYDGEAYRGFIDGILQWTVTSTVKVSPRSYRINFGSFQGNADYICSGYYDEIRVTPFCRYNVAFTPSQVPFTPDDMSHDIFFEASNQMQTWPSGTEVNRCYVGEAVTSATGVTSTVSYKQRDAIDVATRTMASGLVLKAWANGRIGATPTLNKSEGILSISRPSTYWNEVRFEVPAKDIYYQIVYDSWTRLEPLSNGDFSSWVIRTYRKRRDGFDFALFSTDNNDQLVQQAGNSGVFAFSVYERED
jgi:hypothetical protein